jgi:hypothetical protein
VTKGALALLGWVAVWGIMVVEWRAGRDVLPLIWIVINVGFGAWVAIQIVTRAATARRRGDEARSSVDTEPQMNSCGRRVRRAWPGPTSLIAVGFALALLAWPTELEAMKYVGLAIVAGWVFWIAEYLTNRPSIRRREDDRTPPGSGHS